MCMASIDAASRVRAAVGGQPPGAPADDRPGVPRWGTGANPAARSLAGLTGPLVRRDRGCGLAHRGPGHTAGVSDDLWLEAAAAIHAEADADLRADAAEVFAAEAARTHLVDLRGSLRIQLRSGAVVRGRASAGSERIDGHLSLTDAAASGGGAAEPVLLVPVEAVVVIDDSESALPSESPSRPRSLGSWLRDRWSQGEVVRILDRCGATHVGVVTFVGADHVRLDSMRRIAYRAVDAWWG